MVRIRTKLREIRITSPIIAVIAAFVALGYIRKDPIDDVSRADKIHILISPSFRMTRYMLDRVSRKGRHDETYRSEG